MGWSYRTLNNDSHHFSLRLLYVISQEHLAREPATGTVPFVAPLLTSLAPRIAEHVLAAVLVIVGVLVTSPELLNSVDAGYALATVYMCGNKKTAILQY